MAVFIQRSNLGRKTIVLHEECITIAGGSGRKRFESVFCLDEIVPDPERRVARCYALVTIPLAFGFFALLVLQIGISQSTVPRIVVTIPALAFLVLSLWHAIKGLAPLVIVRFRNRRGEVIFDIVKTGGQAAEFEEFVSRVCSEIGRAGQANGVRPIIVDRKGGASDRK